MAFIAHAALLNKHIQRSPDQMGWNISRSAPEQSAQHDRDDRVCFETALNQACGNRFKPDRSNYIL